jgi:branched-subunit amino acid transport protein
VKYVALFLVIFVSIGANLPSSIIHQIGLEPNYLLAALVAIIFTWLCAHRGAFVVILVSLLFVAANLPEETASGIGYDRDYILATLIAIVLLPYIKRLLDWE